MPETAIISEVSQPQMSALLSVQPITLFLSGKGGGKSHFNGIKSLQLIKQFPNVKGFIGANTYDQLNTSTMFRIREYWKSVGIVEYSKANPAGHYVIGIAPPSHFNKEHHNFDKYYNIVSFSNGAIIFIGSLENAKSHEGKEFAWAILDETKDTREEDVKEIILARLREKGIYLVDGELKNEGLPKQQYNPLYVTTSPAKVDWINEWFGLDDYAAEIASRIYSRTDFFEKIINNRKVIIASSYHNVQNVGENYIQNLLDNNSKERGKSIVYANPFTTTGGEFYTSFNRLVHVDEVPPLDNTPVHISYDFNVVPYMTLLLFQIVETPNKKTQVRCFKEYCLPSPKNTTEAITTEAMRDYYDYMKHGLYYYGDATGKARDPRASFHNYDIVQRVLQNLLHNYSDRVPKRNPPVIPRRDFVNALLENKHSVEILMDNNCKHLIQDLEFVKEDQEGRKMKEEATDPVSKQRYQKWGHTSDALDYFLCAYFEAIFDKLY